MASAAFIGRDDATLGTWKGVYGSQGHFKMESFVNNVVQSLPAWLGSVNVANFDSNNAWAAPSAAEKALQRVVGDLRDEIGWQSSQPVASVALAVTDANPHRISMYTCNENANIFERIEVIDSATSVVLYGLDVAGESGSFWLTWDVVGSVTIQFLYRSGGYGSLFHGLFFDPSGSTGPTFRPAWAARVNTLIGGF